MKTLRKTLFAIAVIIFTAQAHAVMYLARPYDPNMGRWLSRDPIGEAGGVNLYGFVENTPISQWDYLGLQAPMIDPNGNWAYPYGMPKPQGFPGSQPETWSGDITFDVKDLVDNVATGTITLGVELARTGEIRMDYERLASELAAKGLSQAEATAARDALKAEFQAKQTALGKAITEKILKQRQQAGHFSTRNNPGKTNVKVNASARVMKWGGRALATVGFAVEVYNVATAPEGEKAGEAARATGRIGGGFLGGWLGGAIGGSWLGPPGAIAGALIFGIGGSFAGEGTVELVCPEKK